MPDLSTETRLAVLETKHEAAEDWRTKTDQTLADIGKALQLLARIEMQNNAQSEKIDALTARLNGMDEKVQAIEKKLLPLEETRQDTRDGFKELLKWVFGAVIGGLLALLGLKHGG